MLLNKVFDEDTSKVESHLVNYLSGILDKGLLTKQDLEGGLNIFGSCLAELSLDVPMIHKYLVNLVIIPMFEKEKIEMSKVTWVAPPKPKVEEDDEDDFVLGNDPFFKMLALLLVELEG